MTEEKKDLTNMMLETEVANELLRMKNVGDTYSDVIKRLLENNQRMKNFITDKGLYPKYEKYYFETSKGKK